jgi:hypothetical protein
MVGTKKAVNGGTLDRVLGGVTLTVVISLATGCRAKDDCYKTYPDAESPTERALEPDDGRPKVEPAPTGPTAETLPPPRNPNNVPR